MNKDISPLKSRIAVTYIFFTLGMLSANWLIEIPAVQTKFHLTSGNLGLLLTGLPVGSVLTMAYIGKFISIYGSKRMTIIGATLVHFFLALLFLIPNIIVLWILLFCFGSSAAMLDVSMNSQGIEVEKITINSIMSSLHAFFSIGGFVGALIGGLFLTLHIGSESHLFIVAVLFYPFTLIAFNYLRVVDEKQILKESKRHKSIIELYQIKEIWILGLIAFIAILAEFVMNDWSLIYVLTVTDVQANIAPIGFALFSLCMTVGRLVGDIVVKYTKTYRLIQYCAAIATVGITISVLANNFIIIFFGYVLVGLGLSIIVPFIFRLAGNQEGTEIGSGLAGVALFGYISTLAEPVFVGQVADFTSLRVSFALVGVLVFLIIFLARNMNRETQAI